MVSCSVVINSVFFPMQKCCIFKACKSIIEIIPWAHSEPHAGSSKACLFFSSVLWVLNNLEVYMLITLIHNIYEHEKCNIDTPLAHPFMCFILQNVVSILFILSAGFNICTAHMLFLFLPKLILLLTPCCCVTEWCMRSEISQRPKVYPGGSWYSSSFAHTEIKCKFCLVLR